MTKNLSNLEIEYNRLKISLCKRSAMVMIGGFAIASGIEFLKAIYYAKPKIFMNPIVLIVCVVVLIKLLNSFEKKQILIITAFNIFGYYGGLYTHYVMDTGYFNNVLDTFHFAYIFALMEKLVVNFIPSFSHKVGFHLCAMVARMIITPINDVALLLVQTLTLVIAIYFELDNEKHHKELFESYSKSREQLKKFKNLVEHYIPEGIIIVSRDLAKPLFVNNAFKDLLGEESILDVRTQLDRFQLQEPISAANYSLDQIRSLTLSNQTLLGFLQKKISVGHGGSTEEGLYHVGFKKAAEERIFEVKILEIIWDEHPALGVVLHDITQQQTIIQLKVAADANKDKVLATVSHELRTPLNGILGMIQIMYKKIYDQELLQYLKICKNSAHLLLGLVNSILDLNQIRANKLKLNYEKIELQGLLNDILALFEFQCSQKNLILKLQISPRLPKTIATDKNRLSQIFVNLIDNALKFTNKGTICVTAHESHSDELIRFTVEDTGIGIKKEDKDKLFKVFGKLDQESSQLNQQGVGLGLAISNNLAQLLSGNQEGIQLDSEYGKGSVFHFSVKKNPSIESSNGCEPSALTASFNMSLSCFDEPKDISAKVKNYQTLPLKKAKNMSSHNRTNSAGFLKVENFHDTLSLGASPTNKNSVKESTFALLKSFTGKYAVPNILIVDDNPFNITIATHLVSYQGFNAKSAFDAQTAIDILLRNDYKDEPIHLILMDCQMPVMDGYQTAKIIKKLMKEGKIPEIPVVALTANDSAIDRVKCQEVGMCDYLAKPLTENNLIKVLKKYSPKHSNSPLYVGAIY